MQLPGGDGETPGTPFGKVTTLEGAVYLRNQLLRDTDWASMAHSLEVRVPLVDAWLTRRVAKWLAHASEPSQKPLLAASPRRPLPSAVTGRAKSGFTTPISRWQQRADHTRPWRGIPVLEREPCPWARRWSYTVAASC
jgi:asparagine synthase (glutamine-hydrolysing)